MDKRKIANQQVKDKLLSALVSLMQDKDLSQITVTELIRAAHVARASFYRNFKTMEELVGYGLRQMKLRDHEAGSSPVEDFNNRELLRYRFQFYGDHADLILAFHHAGASVSLLDMITECAVNAYGGQSLEEANKYVLYYYTGAFYNMILCWVKDGRKETPEAMADMFLRIIDGRK